MVDFLELIPGEVADNIWARMPQRNLSSAMRVSHAWARLTCPFLYRTVSIFSCEGLCMLLRTVSSRPDLALAIRNVAFLRGSYDDPQGKEGEMPITLLQLLPRIRQLEFFEPFELAFLMTNYPIGLNLDNLDTLSAGWQLQDMANVARVWALPAIRTLRIRTKAFHNIDHRIHTLSTWPASCTLRCLEIDKTLLEEASIARMLECSPSLEVLHLRHWFNVAGPPYYNCNSLGHGLRHICSSLQKLRLGIVLYSSQAEELDFLDIAPVQGYLPSFRGFPRLHELEVPIAMLLGWKPSEAPQLVDMLPPSLRTLTLTGDMGTMCTWEWTMDAIEVQLKALFIGLAHSESTLRLVSYHQPVFHESWDGEVVQSLTKMAHEVGMVFTVKYTDD